MSKVTSELHIDKLVNLLIFPNSERKIFLFLYYHVFNVFNS